MLAILTMVDRRACKSRPAGAERRRGAQSAQYGRLLPTLDFPALRLPTDIDLFDRIPEMLEVDLNELIGRSLIDVQLCSGFGESLPDNLEGTFSLI